MQLSIEIIDKIERELLETVPVLFNVLPELYRLGYITEEEHELLRNARREAYRNGHAFLFTNFMICLFILEEQGV